jgi:hypothetical protein
MKFFLALAILGQLNFSIASTIREEPRDNLWTLASPREPTYFIAQVTSLAEDQLGSDQYALAQPQPRVQQQEQPYPQPPVTQVTPAVKPVQAPRQFQAPTKDLVQAPLQAPTQVPTQAPSKGLYAGNCNNQMYGGAYGGATSFSRGGGRGGFLARVVGVERRANRRANRSASAGYGNSGGGGRVRLFRGGC